MREFDDVVDEFILRKYGKNISWLIEMTSKRNPKSKSGDSDYHNKYTMFLIDRTTKVYTYKSKELEGYDKRYWGVKPCFEFLFSLEEI